MSFLYFFINNQNIPQVAPDKVYNRDWNKPMQLSIRFPIRNHITTGTGIGNRLALFHNITR